MTKILAIDDIRDNLISLRAIINDIIPGSTVYAATNGSQGIELALENDPDVILLDVIMPGMDGFEVCQQLKKDDRTSDIPVVFLTALKGDRDNRIKALEAGAEGFLTKPIDETELIAQIRAMVKIKAASRQKRNENQRLKQLVDERTEALLSELSERKRTEEALRESERRFKQVAEGSGTWIWEVDANGLYTYVNDYEETILGYTPDEVVGKKYFYDFFAPEIKDELKKQTFEVFSQKGSFQNFENTNIHKDGHRVILETIGFPILDPTGRLLGYRGADKDISDRKQAEDALRENEEKYRRMVNHLPDSIIIHQEGKIVFANAITFSLLGAESADQVLGKSAFDFVHPDSRAIALERIGKIHQTGESSDFAEEKFITLKGEVLDAEVIGLPVTYQGNHAIQTIVRNITERKKAEKLIQEINELNSSLLQTIPFAMDIVDEQGIVLFQNDRMKQLFGKDVLGHKCWELYRDDSTQCRDCPLLAGIQIGVTKIDESPGILGGRIFEIIHTGMNYQGKKAMLEIFMDITEKKKAEDALIENNSRLEMAMSAANMAWWKLDLTDGSVTFEKRKAEMLGYPPENFKHYSDFTTLVHPEDHDSAMNAMWAHIHGTAEKYETEYRIKTCSGEYIWFYDIGSITKRDEQGKPITVTGLVLNISERKLAEAELILAKERAEEGEQELALKNKELIGRNKFIQTILDNLPIGLSLNEVDGGLATYMNKKFEEIYGWNSNEITSIASFFEHVYPDVNYRNMLIRKVMADIQSGDPDRMHWENIVATRKDGSQRVINAINIPLIEQNTMVSTVTDITDLYKTQLDLQKAKEKAEESDRLKSAFLANMSHEIRTPLNSIMGFSDLLLDEHFDQEQHAEFAQMIHSSGNNLLAIINDIMDISKIEAGQVKLDIRPVSVRKLLVNIHREFSHKAEIKNLEFKLNLTEANEDLVIESDENRLIQVLINFVGNALKFTDKGYIELGAKSVDKFIQFHVRDTGIGIPKEYHDRIFDRFIQVESSDSRKYGGNGLGLAISKSLIEMLGGSIWVDSEQGIGSTFYFMIPVSNDRQSNTKEPEFKPENF